MKKTNYRKSHFLLFIFTFLILSATALAETDAEYEAQIAYRMINSTGQQRSELNYDPILAKIARERAYDMGQRNYFSHVNPDGIGANFLVSQAGFRLPDFYAKEWSGNNIESIAAGSQTALDAWNQWMNSSGHRTHILGLSDFYAGQTEYGIGHAYVPNSQYKHYWVILTAPGY